MSYVVVRVHNGAYLPSQKLWPFRWMARIFDVFNPYKEQVVEWRGSQRATLDHFYAHHGGRTIRGLP